MISKNHHYCARMLIHACEFSESADLLLAMDYKEMRLEVNERYFTPAIVCISFSCELYLKVLLLYYEIDIAKTHKLSDLYAKLPDETKNKIKFDAAYTFVYSPRKGTKAALFDNQIERTVKQKRIAELIDLQSEITYQSNLNYVGSKQRILIEGTSKRDENELCGRTDSGKMVNFKGNYKPGDFVDVTITSAKKTTLFGEIL